MLAAIDLDNQAPLPANEVDVTAIDRLLLDKFEAVELPSANTCPQREFCGVRARRNDRARSTRF